MKTFTQVQEIGSQKAKELTDQLNGLFRAHVSDEFLQAYLGRELANHYVPWKQKKIHPNVKKLAYESASWMFESVLEHGCNTGCNGHHIAQNFAELFEGVDFLSEETID